MNAPKVVKQIAKHEYFIFWISDERSSDERSIILGTLKKTPESAETEKGSGSGSGEKQIWFLMAAYHKLPDGPLRAASM